MRSGNRAIVAALALMPLVACGMIDGRADKRPHAEQRLTGPAVGAGSSATPYEDLPDAPAEPEQPAPAVAAQVADEQQLVGAPYMVDGKAYAPAAVSALDEVGYAAVLWATADGRRTANGEAYVPGAITAAHRTLPLPSYVEVTALDTGRTILVRINDRGPLLNDRIIALSPGAVRQLGLKTLDGTAAVRVRKVSPLEQERAALRSGASVAERIETPPGLRAALIKRLPVAPPPLAAPVRTLSLASPVQPADKTISAPKAGSVAKTPSIVATTPLPPSQPAPVTEPERKLAAVQHEGRPAKPAALPVPVSPAPALAPTAQKDAFVVQIAALSARGKAESLARSVGGFVVPVGTLFRVRTGPYASEGAARTALGSIRAKGYAEARVMANDAR